MISVKLEELANELSKRNSVRGALVDVRLERDTLYIYLKPLDRESGEKASEVPETSALAGTEAQTTLVSKASIRRHRGRRARNRMRTRGWDVVGQVTNKYGQKANVYEPFVEALKDTTLSRTEQRSLVSKILRSNGNTPSADSVDYFLENTLEYLRGQAATGSLST